eukprot:3609034-Rhodomonas_salina.1
MNDYLLSEPGTMVLLALLKQGASLEDLKESITTQRCLQRVNLLLWWCGNGGMQEVAMARVVT